MYKVSINFDLCQACGDCVDGCPSEVLALVDVNGEEKAKAVNEDECIGCDACVAVCPEEAITVEEL